MRLCRPIRLCGGSQLSMSPRTSRVIEERQTIHATSPIPSPCKNRAEDIGSSKLTKFAAAMMAASALWQASDGYMDEPGQARKDQIPAGGPKDTPTIACHETPACREIFDAVVRGGAMTVKV